ncbi:MAG: MFS transporter [Candidatus Ranarchaeia archaeon]
MVRFSLPWSDLSKDTYFITVGSFLLSGALGINTFILPFYFVSLNISLASVGFIFAFNPLIFGSFRYVFGSIGDLMDRRKLLWTSSAIVTGNMFAYPVVRGVPAFATLSMAKGFSGSLRSGSITPLLLVCNPADKKGTALAMNMSSKMGGTALGFVLGGFLLPVFGFFWSFITSGILGLTSLVLFLGVKAKCDVKREKRSFVDTISLRGFNRNTVLMIIVFFFSGIATSFGESFALPLTLRGDFLLTSQVIGLIMAASWLFQSVPGFVAPQYNDKYNPRWLSGVGSLICGGIFLVMYLIYSAWFFIGLFLIYNLIVAIVLNNRWVIIGDAARPKYIGKDLGVASLGWGIGAFIGSNIAGYVAEILGYRMVYGVESIFWIIHALFVIILLEGYPSLKRFKVAK